MIARSTIVALLALVTSSSAQETTDRPWLDRAPVRSSRFYRIKSDLPLEEARAYGRHLDGMHRAYARQLASLPARGRDHDDVYIFANYADYVATLAGWGLDGSATSGIFFVRDWGSGLALWTGERPEGRVKRVIQHEAFHQFAYRRFEADLPHWLSEGLAEFFAESVLVDDELVLGQATSRAVGAVRRAVESGRHVPFESILAMTGEDWLEKLAAGEGDLCYNQAWSMVHFLVYGDERRYRKHFERYLHLINGGTPSRTAFTKVFGDDVAAFEERWKAYALAAKPSAFATALDRLEFLAEGALELSRRYGEAGYVSLDELREELIAIGFALETSLHGHTVRLDAEDESSFRIPTDDLTDEQPVFVLDPPRRRGGSERQRLWEERQPTPPTIRTDHLRPRSLRVRWSRDGTTGDLRYRIDVHRSR